MDDGASGSYPAHGVPRMPRNRTSKTPRKSGWGSAGPGTGGIGSPAGLKSHFRSSARSMEEYGLPDRQSTYASDRAVDSCVVLVRTNDRFHHFGSRTCRIWVQVQHRAPNIPLGNRDGWSVVAIAEAQHSAHPFVLLERRRSSQ